jgi:hypothetical protein
MPVPLEPGDRKILILSGIALVAIVMLALEFSPAPAAESRGIPSTYSNASDGARAAYLLLKDLNYDVERWQMPPAELPSQAAGSVLILAEPVITPSAGDVQAVHRFIREGGTVVGIGALAGGMLPNARTLPYESPGAEWRAFARTYPSPLTRDAGEIMIAPDRQWDILQPGELSLYAQGNSSVVITYKYGQGRVIWWGASTPLENAGIKRAGNMNLLLNCVGAPGKAHILWDEYFHGARGTLFGYFGGTPIPWGLLQTGIIGLALLLTFGRRSGPLRAAYSESRLAPLEFVDTLGDLYHRAHAASSAVGIEYQRFRYLLTRRLGLPPDASIAQLQNGVRERLGWKEPGFFDVLQRTERALRDSTLSDRDALALAQALEQYEDVWQLKPRKSQEKRAWRNR